MVLLFGEGRADGVQHIAVAYNSAFVLWVILEVGLDMGEVLDQKAGGRVPLA